MSTLLSCKSSALVCCSTGSVADTVDAKAQLISFFANNVLYLNIFYQTIPSAQSPTNYDTMTGIQ